MATAGRDRCDTELGAGENDGGETSLDGAAGVLFITGAVGGAVGGAVFVVSMVMGGASGRVPEYT